MILVYLLVIAVALYVFLARPFGSSEEGFFNTSAAWGPSTAAQGCGVGNQTRTIGCSRSDGAAVSEAECTNRVAQIGAKPSNSQQCEVRTGCQYKWISSNFGTCQ